MDSKRIRILIGLALAAITVAAYSRVIGFDFVSFDDPDYVTENKVVKAGLTLHGIAWAFTHCYASNWHPLTWISHMVDCQLFGMWAGGPHVINLLFHTANTVILFLLLYRLTGAQWRSAIVAALFALHPLHVESVAWISERKDVLSTFFALLSLLAYTRYAQGLSVQRPGFKRWKWTALVFFALGLLAKPMVVTLPFLMLLLDFWPLQRMENPRLRSAFIREFRNLMLEKWPWFGLTLGSCAMTYYAQKTGGAVMATNLFPFFWRVINAIEAYFWYLQEIFWPVHLAAFYPLVMARPLTPFLCEFSILLIISALAWLMIKRRPFLLFGWLWFLGTLVPVIGLVQVGGQSAADRYSYIPSIGVFIVVVWFAAELAKPSRVRTAVASAGAGFVLVLCAKLTMSQAETWQDGLALFRHATTVTPTSDVAFISLGETFSAYGENAEAMNALQIALKLNPVARDVRKDIGLVLTREHKPAEALWWYEAEAQLDPSNAGMQNFLGLELTARGKKDEALLHHTEAVRLKPKNAEFQNNLGAALAALGREGAIDHYAEAVRLDPGNSSYQNNYATALARAGKRDDAVEHYLLAIQSDPKNGEAYSNLGAIYFDERRLADAVNSFEKAITVTPKNADAHNNLGNALTSIGKTEQAITEYAQALKWDPTNATIHINLGRAYAKMDRAEEAGREFGEAARLEPTNASVQFRAGLMCVEFHQEAAGLEHFREAIRLRPDWPGPLNAAAWTLATSPDEALRNGTEAIQLAEKASNLTSRQQPAILNTLAAAYGRAGRFGDALATVQEALELAQRLHQTNLVAQIEDAQASYQAHQPYLQKKQPVRP